MINKTPLNLAFLALIFLPTKNIYSQDSFIIIDKATSSKEDSRLSSALKRDDYNTIKYLLDNNDTDTLIYMSEQHLKASAKQNKHDDTAFMLMQRASVSGNTKATETVALMHLSGVGTPVNKSKALKTFMDIDRGTNNLDTILEYADIALYGNQIYKPDSKESYFWLERASEFNHLPSILILIQQYEQDFAKDNSVSKHITRLRKQAFALGHTESSYLLGKHLYLSGSYKKARKWLTLASNNNINESRIYLGLINYNGYGIDENKERAYMHFSLAAMHGVTESKEIRDSIALELNNEELLRARKLTRDELEKTLKGNR